MILPPDEKVSARWKIFLLVSLAAGLCLRLIWTEDMEWKEDEYYNFAQTLLIGNERPWPWAGMNSGVYLANPGMSIWVFVWLARITGSTDPVALQRALGLFSVLGIALLIPFALYFVRRGHGADDREPWFWAYALAMVNPFAILYQRKLWPEPFFPFFSMLMLMGWWKRDRFWGAFVWGAIGACLGQIHMSGFFLAAAFFIWTALFNSYSIPKRPVHWRGWFIGSVLGALPLIPWYLHVMKNPPPGQVLSGTWADAAQLKFWVFWVTDAIGLHLGNPLGIHRGGAVWDQVSDFIRYPLIDGKPTYLSGLAHLVTLLVGVTLVGGGALRHLRHYFEKKATLRWLFVRKVSQTAFAQNAALWGFGIFLTLTRVNIRRYYMMVSFPFEHLWIARLALNYQPRPERARLLLGTLWVAHLLISAFFVGYVHVNRGAQQGDYGEAYHVIRDRHRELHGESWPDLKFIPGISQPQVPSKK